MTTHYSDFASPPKIFINLDPNCYTSYKEEIDQLGGTERFLITLRNWLQNDPEVGWWVTADTRPNQLGLEYDLAIFSNVANDMVKAKKKICFAGSWHSDAQSYPYDEVVCVSDYVRNKIEKGITIPAPFTNDLLKYKDGMFVPNRIFCHSNPNRHYKHTLDICNILQRRDIDFHWVIAGGNKLYSDNFSECFRNDFHDKLFYRGVLPRQEILGLLTSAHLFVYPNFSDNSETLSVAPLEAMALDITTILPNREPFKSCHKGAILCNNENEMVEAIIQKMKEGRQVYNVEEYSEENVKKKWLSLINKILEI